VRITILTAGTKGDVQPYIALGRGLQSAGYQVRLATNGPYRETIEAHGLEFRLTKERQTPVLYGFSPLVVPKPWDWPDWNHLTGHWFLERPGEWNPPAVVTEFLEAGPPPVYLGFSSMIPRDPEASMDIFLRALRQAGTRGIVGTGWMTPATWDLPDDVLVLDEIPHDWLFPRVSAVVHHGGAGTLAAAIQAGVPSIVVPFYADQPFWAARVESLGVGPSPIPERKLTAERLAEAIQRAAADEGIRRKAAELGERIRAEDGVGTAVRIVDRAMDGLLPDSEPSRQPFRGS
jgi:UDP:flavonoid glycosyltransferase YjiC (YdhE family)